MKVESPYARVEAKPIASVLFETDATVEVQVPSIESLLGDKLTAFAPNTIGVKYGIGKSMEIIKQLFDIGELFDLAVNLDEVRNTYSKVYELQRRIQNSDANLAAVLGDTIRTGYLLCQLDFKGAIENNETKELRQGIRQIASHLLNTTFSFTEAKVSASKTAFLAGLIQYATDKADLSKSRYDPAMIDKVAEMNLDGKLQILNKLKAVIPEAFYYWVSLAGISANLKGTKL